MAIIADIVHRGHVDHDIYISPLSINSDSFYTLKYLRGGKNGPPLLGIEMTMRSFTFNNSRAGLSKPDGAGIAYDRSVGAWPQVYADLRAKIAAGACPWITNVRDESEVPTVEVPAAVEAEAVGEPMPDGLRDTLARLVEPDANEAAKKAALLTRWINLKAQMEDKKLPERDRKLSPISTAEMAEFEQLEAYMGWFK